VYINCGCLYKPGGKSICHYLQNDSFVSATRAPVFFSYLLSIVVCSSSIALFFFFQFQDKLVQKCTKLNAVLCLVVSVSRFLSCYSDHLAGGTLLSRGQAWSINIGIIWNSELWTQYRFWYLVSALYGGNEVAEVAVYCQM